MVQATVYDFSFDTLSFINKKEFKMSFCFNKRIKKNYFNKSLRSYCDKSFLNMFVNEKQ